MDRSWLYVTALEQLEGFATRNELDTPECEKYVKEIVARIQRDMNEWHEAAAVIRSPATRLRVQIAGTRNWELSRWQYYDQWGLDVAPVCGWLRDHPQFRKFRPDAGARAPHTSTELAAIRAKIADIDAKAREMQQKAVELRESVLNGSIYDGHNPFDIWKDYADIP